ncbi:hypothetical protein XA67_23390 [Comamonas thiooxydans]|nr:hypothetical protein XA67_23390 [Comamonas thiooxydans]
MTTKKKVGWSDLKAQLVGLEKTELLQLVKDLYSSSKDTQHELSPLIVQVFVRMPSGSLLGGN